MAKRANPYSEDFIQQSKIFVNLKQFNNNEDRLKKVYASQEIRTPPQLRSLSQEPITTVPPDPWLIGGGGHSVAFYFPASPLRDESADEPVPLR
ncbi:hypothetical protein KGM_215348 [Danaus plexippus plexippus]|uniref:Uncharacterized protein n=1 Tax=Danaus plexippus plexippus TaxID=278856 RepID=A0A212F5G5_DANPL|nr:hypothetical protein KGM_215348 [Danaus plexippus plexippus]